MPDPQNLKLWLEVDGHRYQDGSTSTMIFSVARLVSYVSQFMSLHPGDVISTGTPSGVGAPYGGRLKPGDQVTIELSGIGRLVNPVVQGV